MNTRTIHLPLDMERQPTDSTCGPTCLHALYRFYGVERPLEEIVEEIPQLAEGGTISVYLGCHALLQGFKARLYTYNLRIFDPTWWSLDTDELIEKLLMRIPHLENPKLAESHQAYVRYLRLGGQVLFRDLTPRLIQGIVKHGHPVLTGLSATYLYESTRELPDGKDDDIAGSPVGHFVVVTGYVPEENQVIVTDPYGKNPFNPHGEYRVSLHRFLNAVLLGIVTYDANLLVLQPNHIHQSAKTNPLPS